MKSFIPAKNRSTFFHGVFDDAPVVFTELANTPDWLELEIVLDGERFGLDIGQVLEYRRWLDLRSATLRRTLRWQSPRGRITRLNFERFASLADEHLAGVRLEITPENYAGSIEIRSGINAEADNLGLKHWQPLAQGVRADTAWLSCQTRASRVRLTMGIHLQVSAPRPVRRSAWDVHGHPSINQRIGLAAGETLTVRKWAAFYTSRDLPNPEAALKQKLRSLPGLDWQAAYAAHCQAWEAEWARADVVIEGDDEAQMAVRFNLFQLLVAAPRRDERVNIGAKTLSGYGYRGHAFWDTEIFMLPFFTYTRPEIARNLLSYRYHNLAWRPSKSRRQRLPRARSSPGRAPAPAKKCTPTWVPHYADRTKLVRIWTGDIEIHISADVALRHLAVLAGHRR